MELDGVRDGVAMSRAKHQSLQDQHVERSLDHFTLQRGFAPWHGSQYTPVDDLPKLQADIRRGSAFVRKIVHKMVERSSQFYRLRLATGRVTCLSPSLSCWN